MPDTSRENALTLLLPVVTGAAFLAAWQAFTLLWHIPAVILPAPSDVLHNLGTSWSDLIYEARFTGSESLLACVLAGLLGALSACLLSCSVLVRETLYPNLVAFQLLPKIALAPLFVVWLGIDAPSA